MSAKILNMLGVSKYTGKQEDFKTCHQCNTEVTEDNIVLAKYNEDHGWIVAPPEQLCYPCLNKRIEELD